MEIILDSKKLVNRIIINSFSEKNIIDYDIDGKLLSKILSLYYIALSEGETLQTINEDIPTEYFCETVSTFIPNGYEEYLYDEIIFMLTDYKEEDYSYLNKKEVLNFFKEYRKNYKFYLNLSSEKKHKKFLNKLLKNILKINLN
uniref:Uncharacterized protein n=1 Tax=viral metagenome TaxID=1070528 RepID=A0A6C0AFR2_9ZZZZ